MNRAELLAAVLAERQDYRWFATPQKPIKGDDEMTIARRRKAAIDDDMAAGRWVTRRGIQVWIEESA